MSGLGTVGEDELHPTMGLTPAFRYTTWEEHEKEAATTTSQPLPTVYGVRSEPIATIVKQCGDFNVELYKGFTAVPEMHHIGARITYAKRQTIPRDRVFVIHLFVDVSGSMDTVLDGSDATRLEIIRSSLTTMKQTLLPMVRKGLRVRLSLHTFSNECKEVIPTTDATESYLSEMNWSRYLRSEAMTNLWDCVRAVRNLTRTQPQKENETHTFLLLSDGQHTTHASRPDGDVKVFDYAVGIGTSDEYDPSILSLMSKHPIEACPDATTLSATLLRLGCSEYMTLARNVSLTLGDQTTHIPEWVAGSQVIVSCMIPTRSEFGFQYSYEKGEHACIIPLDESSRTHRTQRHVADLCRLHQTSHAELERMKGEYDIDVIRAMIRRCRVATQRFTETSWAHTIASGMLDTWNTLSTRLTLPALDRGLSIQSAIRQSSCNYYDTQTEENTRAYTQKAF